MRSIFVEQFFEFLREGGALLGGILNNEPIYYLHLRSGGIDPHQMYQGMRNLQSRGLLRSAGKGSFILTPGGKKWAKDRFKKYFKLKQQKWDSKWRVVIFDVPAEKDRERGIFRRRLKALGFYMLQKSVFVIPYPCEEEIGDLAGPLGISDYIDVIVANSVGFKEKEIRKFFELR